MLEVEETLPGPAGPRHWLVLKFPLRGDTGSRLVGAVAVDISDRRRRESTLHRMAAILESSHDAVISTTPDGIVTSWNSGAAEMYGYAAGEMVGQHVSRLEPPDREGQIGEILERMCGGEPLARYETERVRKDGTTVEVAVAVSPIRDESGDLTGIASIARDISDRKRAQALIAFQSFHDPLTGLSNRALLMERLNLCLGKARRSARRLAVLFLDLDLFKSINDGFGHDFGDEMFREVARRLLQCVRDDDTVARVGGDEFVVLLPEIGKVDDALVVSRKLLETVALPVFRGRPAGGSDDEHRHCDLPGRRPGGGSAPPQRRRGDVAGEGARPEQLSAFHRGADGRIGQAALAAGRSAPGHRERTSSSCTISRFSRSPRGESSRWKLSCGGSIRATGSSCPATSSRSLKKPE